MLDAISTHAPRTGSDDANRLFCLTHGYFNPRSPHGERRCSYLPCGRLQRISTHAPRTGSDVFAQDVEFLDSAFQPTLPARGATSAKGASRRDDNFNPRSPHGERLRQVVGMRWLSQFQPTLPARGATAAVVDALPVLPFQPTLPARGATGISGASVTQLEFQPTLPARGATEIQQGTNDVLDISTHAPRTGSDMDYVEYLTAKAISTHAPRTGSDRQG